MSAIVIGIAPVAFAALLLATGRGAGLLDHGVIGLVILGTGLALEVLGLIVASPVARPMRHIDPPLRARSTAVWIVSGRPAHS